MITFFPFNGNKPEKFAQTDTMIHVQILRVGGGAGTGFRTHAAAHSVYIYLTKKLDNLGQELQCTLKVKEDLR